MCCGAGKGNFFFPRQQREGPSSSRARRKPSRAPGSLVTTVFHHTPHPSEPSVLQSGAVWEGYWERLTLIAILWKPIDGAQISSDRRLRPTCGCLGLALTVFSGLYSGPGQGPPTDATSSRSLMSTESAEMSHLRAAGGSSPLSLGRSAEELADDG